MPLDNGGPVRDRAPLATVLASPTLAREAAAALKTVSVPTPKGRTVGGALAEPKAAKAPALILIHEWWGVNDQIKAVTAEFAAEGFLTFAIDLFGKVATTRDEAVALMNGVDADVATDALVGAVDWLRKHPRSTGKVGTIGWCFGGTWSLNAGIAAPVDAVVVYYGWVNRKAEDLAKLRAPVLGHFGSQDQSVKKSVVDEFEAGMKQADKPYTVNWYDAGHAFANPTSASYASEAAKSSWGKTLAYLRERLGG